MHKLIEILKKIRSGVDWENETQLIDGGLIDSFDIIALIGDLNDEFNVHIDLEHMTPENFNSAQAILDLLKSLGANI